MPTPPKKKIIFEFSVTGILHPGLTAREISDGLYQIFDEFEEYWRSNPDISFYRDIKERYPSIKHLKLKVYPIDGSLDHDKLLSFRRYRISYYGADADEFITDLFDQWSNNMTHHDYPIFEDFDGFQIKVIHAPSGGYRSTRKQKQKNRS